MSFETFVADLERTPLKDRLKKIQEPYLGHNTVLRAVVREPQALKAILDLIPAGDRFDAVTFIDYTKFAVIYDAILLPDSFKVIFESLPQDDRVRFLAFRNQRPSLNHTFFHFSILCSGLLDIVLALTPGEELLKLIDLTSHSGLNCLQLAAHNPTALAELINLFPRERQAQLVEEHHLIAYVCYDERPDFVIYYNHKNDPIALMTLLLLIRPERRLNIVLHKLDDSDNTILHWLIPNPICLSVLLEQLPPKDHFSALTALNREKKTPVHYAGKASFNVIEKLVSRECFSELGKILNPPYPRLYNSLIFTSQPDVKRAKLEEHTLNFISNGPV